VHINTNSNVPIYEQIAKLIEDQILSDELQADSKVYSTNQLAKLFSINPATARKGLTILIDKNIIYKKRGVGMFVYQNAKEIILQEKSNQFYSNFIENMLLEAKKIGLSKHDVIQLIKNGAK
jgi:DNA-binding transcriptional regulator YhcF (GntR family)